MKDGALVRIEIDSDRDGRTGPLAELGQGPHRLRGDRHERRRQARPPPGVRPRRRGCCGSSASRNERARARRRLSWACSCCCCWPRRRCSPAPSTSRCSSRCSRARRSPASSRSGTNEAHRGRRLPGLALALGLDRARARPARAAAAVACCASLSPGSFAFYDQTLLVRPLTAWKPISVSPPDTLRGLAFLAAFALLAVAVELELGDGRWRRRLLRTVVYTGLALTIVALLQAVSPEPRRLYGVWQPTLGLGRLRPVRQPQPLRGLPGDGGRARARVRARGARAPARGVGRAGAAPSCCSGRPRARRSCARPRS